MILFTVSSPSKYELLIDALLRAIDSNPKKKEDYEQLIDELNRSLTSRTTVPVVGDQLHWPGSESKNVLRSKQNWPEGICRNNESGCNPVLRIPAHMDSARSRHIHYPPPEQPAGYDYLRKAH
jgi:hypothetical protein